MEKSCCLLRECSLTDRSLAQTHKDSDSPRRPKDLQQIGVTLYHYGSKNPSCTLLYGTLH